MEYTTKLLKVSSYQPGIVKKINREHSLNIGYNEWKAAMTRFRGDVIMIMQTNRPIRIVVGSVLMVVIRGAKNDEAWAHIMTPSNMEIMSGAAVVTICSSHGMHVNDIIVSEDENVSLNAKCAAFEITLVRSDETIEDTEDIPVEELKVDPLRKLDPTLN